MPYLLACVLLVLSGLTFAVTAPILNRLFDLPRSDAWLWGALAFGLIASSLPVLQKRRSLKDAMIAIALFAIYTGGITSVHDSYRHKRKNTTKYNINHIKSY